MLDPLQNLLHCMDFILWARQKQRELKPDDDPGYRLLQMVGEMDHVCEIQRQVEEIRMVNVNDFDVAIPAGDMFDIIFEHQEVLMHEYHEIEQNNLGRRLPDPGSFNLDNPECQNRLKEFAWRITEELAEATSCLTFDVNEQGVIHYLEEMVDALHFTIEFNLMCGMIPDKLLMLSEGKDKLVQMFEQNPQYPKNLGLDSCQASIRIMTWAAVEKLGEAMNCLKNKPWKTTHMKTDVGRFHRLIVEFNHHLFSLFSASGFDAVTLTKCYLNKNAVNQFRIRSRY